MSLTLEPPLPPPCEAAPFCLVNRRPTSSCRHSSSPASPDSLRPLLWRGAAPLLPHSKIHCFSCPSGLSSDKAQLPPPSQRASASRPLQPLLRRGVAPLRPPQESLLLAGRHRRCLSSIRLTCRRRYPRARLCSSVAVVATSSVPLACHRHRPPGSSSVRLVRAPQKKTKQDGDEVG